MFKTTTDKVIISRATVCKNGLDYYIKPVEFINYNLLIENLTKQLSEIKDRRVTRSLTLKFAQDFVQNFAKSCYKM